MDAAQIAPQARTVRSFLAEVETNRPLPGACYFWTRRASRPSERTDRTELKALSGFGANDEAANPGILWFDEEMTTCRTSIRTYITVGHLVTRG